MSETPGSDNPPPPPPPPSPPPGYPTGPSYPAPNQGPPAYSQPGPGGYQQFPGYPGGPADGYGGYTTPEQRAGWSGLAIASFVTGLLLPIIGLVVAIPLGIVALVKISGTRLKGRWMAIAGIVLAVLWLAGFIALGAYLASQEAERDASGRITGSGALDFGDVREGDCLSLPSPQGGSVNLDVTDLEGVPCGDSHNAEAVLVVPVDADSYPGIAGLDKVAQKPCHDAVLRATGRNSADFLAFRLRPEESVWDDDGGHRVLCFAMRSDGADITDLRDN